jgi:hypothetical protein
MSLRMIPTEMRAALDYVVGIVTIASPWLFGFGDEGANAWLPFVVIGLLELGAAAMTDPESQAVGRRHAHAS